MDLHIEGMTRSNVAEIGTSLANKAGAAIERERRASLEITHAKWLYANAPYMRDSSYPSAAELQRDSAHRAADGKRYEIKKGLFVGGKWTCPVLRMGVSAFQDQSCRGWKRENSNEQRRSFTAES